MESSDYKKYIFVEYLDTLNNVITSTFQRMKRVKLRCFDMSTHFIVFGASSGGIYIFRKNPCEFVKLIPSKEGSANKVAISPDEKNLGIASSSGLTIIIEDFYTDVNLNYQVYNEHDGHTVTAMKWHGNDLYCGDNTGKISVISPKTLLSKAIFQTPSTTLMHLDSSIVQIDNYLNYLLVSTKSKTYLCDTEKEQYKQIGKKLRDGLFGACFFDTSNKSNDDYSFPSNSRKTYTTLNDNDMFLPSVDNTEVRIYCARPGARLWEVNFEASVLTTRQFKGARTLTPPDFIQVSETDEKIVFTDISNGAQQLPAGFNFGNIYILKNKFMFTFDEKGIYIFDPLMTELVFWCDQFKEIKDIVIIDNTIYIWQGNLSIKVVSIHLLAELILNSLYTQQYSLCIELCTHYCRETIKLLGATERLQLVSLLKENCDKKVLLDQLQPISDSVNELQKRMSKIKIPSCSTGIVRVDNNGHIKPEIESTSTISTTDQEVPSIDPVISTTEIYLRLLYKQYKLNKTHDIDIPEVSEVYKDLDLNKLFELFQKFIEYVKEKCDEDTSLWCYKHFLRQASLVGETWKHLNKETVQFLSDSFLAVNESSSKFVCSCSFPLPNSKVLKIKYENVAKFIFENHREMIDSNYLKRAPYFYKLILMDTVDINLPLLVQYSDIEVLEYFLPLILYDTWDEALKLYVKLCNKSCLNCGKAIDNTNKISWTDLGLLIIQSIGPKNTLKLLERYSKFIPSGELDGVFYQATIFTGSFGDSSQSVNSLGVQVVKLARNKESQKTMDELIKQYIQSKILHLMDNQPDNIHVRAPHLNRTCNACTLTLLNDILKDTVECERGHSFHKYCFELENGICNVCSNKD